MQHMGVPTASVCMGFMPNARMPVNLTFAGKHGTDAELLKYAYAYEKQTGHRIEPPITPGLESDRISLDKSSDSNLPQSTAPSLHIQSAREFNDTVRIDGEILAAEPDGVHLEAFVDGQAVPKDHITRSQSHWSIEAKFSPYDPPKPSYGGMGFPVSTINIIILLRSGGYVAGKLVMVPQPDKDLS